MLVILHKILILSFFETSNCRFNHTECSKSPDVIYKMVNGK